MKAPLLRLTVVGLFALFLAACGPEEEEVRVYELTRPGDVAGADRPTPQAPATGPMAGSTSSAPGPMAGNGGMPPPPSSGASGAAGSGSVNPSSQMQTLPGMEEAAARIERPQWQVPGAWQVLEPTPIRKGNFRVAQGEEVAEITVTAFPGSVGGLASNVNRWRRQVGLAPLDPDQIAALTVPVQVDGATAELVSIRVEEGAPSGTQGVLGVVIPRGELTWFVKMIGSSALLHEERNNLQRFAESFQFPR